MSKLYFSVNEYDKDGDVVDSGIFIHFENTRVKVADDVAGLALFREQLAAIETEIRENY